MEDVLDLYHAPYDPLHPVVCMDESSKQLVGDVTPPVAAAPGHGQLVDHEYVRHGVAEIFLEVEPLTGRSHVTLCESRTRHDWARFIAAMLDERYPHATTVHLVLDNLNNHTIAALYDTFPPDQARRLAQRLDIHYTPKHGSWLNIAEIELSCLKRQCLHKRIPAMDLMQTEVNAWLRLRHANPSPVHWRFSTQDARIKLKRLYPKL
jgi:hypothetical protein